jgi:hypothetical protein
MGDMRAIGGWPEVRVKIETEGRLSARNVGRFLQSLDTAGRSVPATRSAAPRVEIVSITSGSIEIIVAVLALGVSATSLAFQIREFFRSNTAAIRIGRDLIVNDNATSISISGGTNIFLIGHQDVPHMEEVLNEASAAASAPAPSDNIKIIPGPHLGSLHRFSGNWWVELDRRPGMTLRIRDSRPEHEPLESDRRYRLVGDAYIAPEGAESTFVLRSAEPL